MASLLPFAGTPMLYAGVPVPDAGAPELSAAVPCSAKLARLTMMSGGCTLLIEGWLRTMSISTRAASWCVATTRARELALTGSRP